MSTLGGQELLDLAGEEPARALQETERQLGAPNLDPVDHVWLLRARGVALRCAGRTAESAEELQSAAAIAAELDPDLLAGVETSLAATLMFLGQVPGALEVMDAAIARSKGLPHIEALLQAGAVNLAIGRHNVALEVLSRAIPLAQETGRAKWEADSLNQRGMAFIFDGQSGRALPDLERSVEVASAHGDGLGAAMASCNRALALHRVGRLAESLASFRDVAADYERVGVSAHEIAADWSEALLAAGLFDDAVRITTEAASHFRKTSNVWGSMQCTAIAAEAAFAQGRPDLVKTILHAARATPGSADFTGWLARTELAHVRSQLEADPDALDLEEIDALAATLAAGGQADASLAARIARLRVAGIATSPPRPSGSVDDAGLRSSVARAPTLVQLDYWSTLTALRAHGGDSRGALGAFAAAERRARDVLATTGSYEVRVHASRHLELAADAATGGTAGSSPDSGSCRSGRTAPRCRAGSVCPPQPVR